MLAVAGGRNTHRPVSGGPAPTTPLRDGLGVDED